MPLIKKKTPGVTILKMTCGHCRRVTEHLPFNSSDDRSTHGVNYSFYTVCRECGTWKEHIVPHGSGIPLQWRGLTPASGLINWAGSSCKEAQAASETIKTNILNKENENMNAEEKIEARNGKREFYILWNAESNYPPKVMFGTYDLAAEAADEMAKKHEETFFVMKAISLHRITKPVDRVTIGG